MENLKKLVAWAAQQTYSYWEEAARELQPLTGEKLVEDQPLYNNYEWVDDDTILTNKGIFDLTGIMLHERSSGYYDGRKWEACYLITDVDRSSLGAIVRDPQAWRFIPITETRWGYKSLMDIGRTVLLLNRRDKIKSSVTDEG